MTNEPLPNGPAPSAGAAFQNLAPAPPSIEVEPGVSSSCRSPERLGWYARRTSSRASVPRSRAIASIDKLRKIVAAAHQKKIDSAAAKAAAEPKKKKAAAAPVKEEKKDKKAKKAEKAEKAAQA